MDFMGEPCSAIFSAMVSRVSSRGHKMSVTTVSCRPLRDETTVQRWPSEAFDRPSPGTAPRGRSEDVDRPRTEAGDGRRDVKRVGLRGDVEGRGSK